MSNIRYSYTAKQLPAKVTLSEDKNAGHGDHWCILSTHIETEVPKWLQSMLDKPLLPQGLGVNTGSDTRLLIASEGACNIHQIFALENGKPTKFINAFACVESPYGLDCYIERIIACDTTGDSILRLRTMDGTIIYAFDQLYTINRHHYLANTRYHVNFSAWAYNISPSNQNESIKITDPDAIRYHRAFNDIVAANNGETPKDIDKQIQAWKPNPDDQTELAPVEINLGHMCAYLFGETFGQEDEAWIQGQVLGKQDGWFFDKAITLFDVVALREHNAKPFVLRIATPKTTATDTIAVHDYIQANIWLQAAIYAQNQ